MSRSVSVPRDASVVAYTQAPYDESPDVAADLYGEYVADLQRSITTRYPSMRPHNTWHGSENRVVARNDFAMAGVSEYCGLVAVWMVAECEEYPELAHDWLRRVGPGFEARYGSMRPVGTASNGEQFFTGA